MIHYLIHQQCNKNGSGGLCSDLTGDVNIIDFTITFIQKLVVRVWMDKRKRKTILALRNII